MSYDSIYTELANIKQEIVPLQSMQKDIDSLKDVIMKLNDKMKEKDERIKQLENSLNKQLSRIQYTYCPTGPKGNY